MAFLPLLHARFAAASRSGSPQSFYMHLRQIQYKFEIYNHSGLNSCKDYKFLTRNASTVSSSWKNTPVGDVSVELGSHKRMLRISTGQYARFADGCVVVSFGDTSVLVTAVGKTLAASANPGFVPLSVDYRQKAAAAGRIPTNFLRRELGPSEKEILTGRMIDRSIRPLFERGKNKFTVEAQITCNALALDGNNDPDVLCINGASAALAISDIPWNGPIAAVRVGRIGTELIINPTRREMLSSDLNLIVAANTRNRVVMLEADAKGIFLQDFQQAIKTGVKECQKIIRELEKLRQQVGKTKRDVAAAAKKQQTTPIVNVETYASDAVTSDDAAVSLAEEREAVSGIENVDYTTTLLSPPSSVLTSTSALSDIEHTIHDLSSLRLRDIFTNSEFDKIQRDDAVKFLRDETISRLRASFSSSSSPAVTDPSLYYEAFSNVSRNIFRRLILETDLRCDGRDLRQIRPISCDVDLYKPLHGSALFTRGQTQCLCTVTFDSIDSALKNDPVSIITGGLKEKNFFLHYEFPSFATNEVGGKVGGKADRRELGHGALAEKALRCVIPENFPYTIRLTSEVLESNGSSSMASVCGGSLALMDAGVPIHDAVAGVAIGLVTKTEKSATQNDEEITDYRLLTDILGIEDYLGDMDFKFCGTATGVTALQADVKLPGLPLKIVMEALQQANDAKNSILGIMNSCLSAPRAAGAKDNSPVSETIEISLHHRPRFIGIGGRNIKRLTAETGCQASPVDDTHFALFAPNAPAMAEAKQMIANIMAEEQEPTLEFGAIYPCEIVEIKDGGVLISLHSKVPPIMMPNSQLDERKVNHASALGFEVGQKLNVKYFGRDPATGRHRVSRKALRTTHVGQKKLPDRAAAAAAAAAQSIV